MKHALQPGWTLQRIIDHLKQHFANDVGPCKTEGTSYCHYRSDLLEDTQAKACAVGCFLTDDQAMNLEGSWLLASGCSKVMDADVPLEYPGMAALQGVHDNTPYTEPVLPVLLNWIENNVTANSQNS